MPRGGARPNTGGARPGAGRKLGSVGAKTKMLRAISDRELKAGIMPVQVMLQTMRAHWTRAAELKEEAKWPAPGFVDTRLN